MKEDIHSFHMRYGGLISNKRLRSYECCTFLTLVCLVFLSLGSSSSCTMPPFLLKRGFIEGDLILLNPYFLRQLCPCWVEIFCVNFATVRARAKKISTCLKFLPQICQAKWPAHAQPIGLDGTCVTQLSSINFARPCRWPELFHKKATKCMH